MWRGGEAGITERGLTSAVSAASPRPASSLLCLVRQEVEIYRVTLLQYNRSRLHE